MTNLKEVMKTAHKLAKTFTGNYQARLVLALKIAWASIKKGVSKMDERIEKLHELAKTAGTYNRIWNEVEELSKQIRGRKFNWAEQNSFGYEASNLIAFAEVILSEEVKTVAKKRTSNTYGNGLMEAKHDGYDAETGEEINVGDLIQHVSGIGWVRADNC